MDILKARRKAKEHKQREAEERAHEAALKEDIERARARAAPVDEPTVPEAVAGSRPPSGGDAGPAARGRASQPPVRVDPLQEFLASYDDGDLVDDVEGGYAGAEPTSDDEKRFLSFDLAGEAYAASIMDIREILKVVSLTEVPRAPREVLGVLSKRGVVMPVADLAAVLGLRESDQRPEGAAALDRSRGGDPARTAPPGAEQAGVLPPLADQRVLVAGDGDRVCGLRVDRVSQVVRLSQRAIEEVPPSLGAKNAHMLLGLGRARVEGHEQPLMFILLDVPAVLAHFAETMGIEALKEGR